MWCYALTYIYDARSHIKFFYSSCMFLKIQMVKRHEGKDDKRTGKMKQHS